MAIYRETFSVRTYDVDPSGNATVGALCRFLQETAATHAMTIGYGLKEVRDAAHFWVLSRLLLRVERLPRWRDSVTVETWPSGTEGLFALRDWVVTAAPPGKGATPGDGTAAAQDEGAARPAAETADGAEGVDTLERGLADREGDGSPAVAEVGAGTAATRSEPPVARTALPGAGRTGAVAARATGSWVVVNIETRAPARIDTIADRMDFITDRRVLERSARKVPPFDGAEHQSVVHAGMSDMDLNDHLNNVRTVEWLIDVLPPHFLRTMLLQEIEINFLGEGAVGDALDIRATRVQEPSGEVVVLHAAVRRSDGASIGRARSRWRTGTAG